MLTINLGREKGQLTILSVTGRLSSDGHDPTIPLLPLKLIDLWISLTLFCQCFGAFPFPLVLLNDGRPFVIAPDNHILQHVRM